MILETHEKAKVSRTKRLCGIGGVHEKPRWQAVALSRESGNMIPMSKVLPSRPRIASKAKQSFALVVSGYNGEYTSALEKNARAELLAIHPGAKVETFEAPGSFEIPLLVNLLAKRKKYSAILGLGVIIEGRTAHASLIAGTITQSLQKISLEHSVPVIHEVLLVHNEAQARERCIGAKLNRGREAARAAATAARSVRASLKN